MIAVLEIVIGAGLLLALLVFSKVAPDPWGHWADRQLIHTFSAPGLGLAIRRVLATLVNRGLVPQWLVQNYLPTIVIGMVLALTLEPFDVLKDGPVKSYVDAGGWLNGFILWWLGTRKELREFLERWWEGKGW